MYTARLLASVVLRHSGSLLRFTQKRHIPSSKSFSTTPTRRAADLDSNQDSKIQEQIEALERSGLGPKLAANPEAMEALKNFSEMLEKAGFDATRKPSTYEMIKFAANPEFRAAALKLSQKMSAAGIDMKELAGTLGFPA